MLLLVLCFATFSGVRGENNCDGPPECAQNLNFQMNVTKLVMDFETMGGGLPPDQFFQENCDFLVEFLQCYQQFCGLQHLIIDLDALIRNAIEFCNEESDIRKAYVAHVDCFNRIELTRESCASSIMQRAESSILSYDIQQPLMKNTVDRLCMLFHFAVTCTVDITVRTCGRAAGNAAVDFLNRAMDIAICSPRKMDLFDGILGFFKEVKSEQLCNMTVCSGPEELMDMIANYNVFPLEDDLQRHCSEFQETLRCPADRISECPAAANSEDVVTYNEFLEVLNDLCREDSRFRTTYLESVSCYNSILDNFTACTYNIKDHINQFMLDEHFSPLPFGVTSPLKFTCLAVDLIPNCYVRTAADNCGAKAAITIGKLILGIQKLSLNMNCNEPHISIWRDEFRIYLSGKSTDMICGGEARDAYGYSNLN